MILRLWNGMKYLSETYENTVRKELNDMKIRCIRYTTTWECNSKCDSCFIWKMDSNKSEIMTLNELDRFSKSRKLQGVRRIIISGGEPFLLDDLPDRLYILHRNIPKAYFGMTCNGLTPERTATLINKIYLSSPDIDIRNVGLSLNGRPSIHDRSRGIKGAFQKTMATFHLIRDKVPVRFSFLFLPYNISDYVWVRNFAKRLNTEAYLCWTVISNRFFDREFLGDMDIDSFYKKIRPLLNKYTDSIVKRYLYNSFINKRHLDCTAFRDFFHLTPEGVVHGCNFYMPNRRILGNVKFASFSEIWDREQKKREIINEIKTGKCLYPEHGGVCGDSDINYSVTNSSLFKVFQWYLRTGGKI